MRDVRPKLFNFQIELFVFLGDIQERASNPALSRRVHWDRLFSSHHFLLISQKLDTQGGTADETMGTVYAQTIVTPRLSVNGILPIGRRTSVPRAGFRLTPGFTRSSVLKSVPAGGSNRHAIHRKLCAAPWKRTDACLSRPLDGNFFERGAD
jgi:hypothetical protein